MAYTVFCDESGQRDYGRGTDNFFVVSGVIVDDRDVDDLCNEIRGLKRALWGKPEAEIKSNWLRIPKERSKRYIDGLGLTQADIDGLMESLIKWIRRAPITFLAGVVDKRLMEEKYAKPHYAGTVAYTLLLQRFQKFLDKNDAEGAVEFDDPAGKSPGGHNWRDLLRRLHFKLRRQGCPYTGMEFEDVNGIRFADSAESHFIQIADLLAYNVFRQFRDHGAVYDDPDARSLPLYGPFADMSHKLDCSSGGVFAGYGVAKWPADVRNKWRVPGR